MSRRTWKLMFVCLAFSSASALHAAEPLVSCNFNKQRAAQQSPGPALVAEVPAAMTPIPLNAIQIADKKIARKVMVEGIYARRTATATLEVMTRMVNCTDYPQQVQLRSSFMDEQKFPVEAASAWQRVFLPGRSIGVYQETSIGTYDVAYFLIEMQEGD